MSHIQNLYHYTHTKDDLICRNCTCKHIIGYLLNGIYDSLKLIMLQVNGNSQGRRPESI